MKREKITITVPMSVKNKLDSLAQDRAKTTKNNVYASDIAREALQEYFDKRGIDLEVSVDRGGNRRKDDTGSKS